MPVKKKKQLTVHPPQKLTSDVQNAIINVKLLIIIDDAKDLYLKLMQYFSAGRVRRAGLWDSLEGNAKCFSFTCKVVSLLQLLSIGDQLNLVGNAKKKAIHRFTA